MYTSIMLVRQKTAILELRAIHISQSMILIREKMITLMREVSLLRFQIL